MAEQEEIAAMLIAGLEWVEAHLRASLDEPLASHSINFFASVLDYDLSHGALSYAELQQLRLATVPVADVGLGLLDGVICTVKSRMKDEEPDANIARLVIALEHAVDTAVEAGGGAGMITTRNGKYAGNS